VHEPKPLVSIPEKTILHGSKSTQALGTAEVCIMRFWSWVGIALCVLAYFIPKHLLKVEHTPPVGAYIALMGLVAAGVTFRKEPSAWEKAIWIVLMTLLVLAEFKNLYIARNEETKTFRDISTSLERNIKAITGGDSFAVAALYGITGNTAHLSFKQSGDYTLHEVSAFFDDLDKYKAWYLKHNPLRAGEKFPGEHTYNLGDLPRYGTSPQGTLELSKTGENNFFFNFVALNGFWAETIHARRINGKWLQALIVTWDDLESNGKGVRSTSRRVYSYADDGYPRKSDGSIDFDY
jgi:hypothetical protein